MAYHLARQLHTSARYNVLTSAPFSFKSQPSTAVLCSFHRTALSGNKRCPQKRRLHVSAAWGDDIQWSSARIVKTEQAAKGHQTLLLEVGAPATQQYKRAGQYLQVKLKDSKPGFFAIASSPVSAADGVVELLVRKKGDTAELLCSCQAGTEVEASPIGGPGFRLEKASPEYASQVLIFATGSGISPIKALIESGDLQTQNRKSVKLYWGTRDAESTAYSKIIPDWEAQGIQVTSVYSTDGNGYVQDVFEKENELQNASSVAVILCGHKEMCQAITKQMEDAGVDKEKILLNF